MSTLNRLSTFERIFAGKSGMADVAMGDVGDPPVGDQRPGKRLKVELEPLPLDKVVFFPRPPALSRPVAHL